jgi:hypothetical protein
LRRRVRDQENRNEGDDLLLHVLQRAERGEQQGHHGNDEHPSTRGSGDEGVDQGAQGARLVDRGEGSAEEEDEEDHRARIGHALGDRDEGVERGHRVRHRGSIRTCGHHVAAGGFVLVPVILSGGKNPGRYRRESDAHEEQGQRVRELHCGFSGL